MSNATYFLDLPSSYVGDAASLASAKAAKERARLAFNAKAKAGAAKASTALRAVTLNAPKVKIVGGKVQIPVTSFWADWNKQFAKVMVPFVPAINAAPLTVAQKTLLKTRPLDAVLDLFDPIEDRIGRAVDRVILKKGATQNYFGKMRNIKRTQPIDAKADASTQNLMKTLRTIDAFVVLFFTQPVELAAECLKEGLNIAGDAVSAVKQAGAAALKAGGAALNEVSSWFGIGAADGGVVSAPTAVAATAAAGAGIDAVITATLAAITTILTAAATAAATAAVNAAMTGGDPLKAGASAAQQRTGLELAVQVPGLRPVLTAPSPPPASVKDRTETQVVIDEDDRSSNDFRFDDDGAVAPSSTPPPAASGGGNAVVYALAGAAALGVVYLATRK